MVDIPKFRLRVFFQKSGRLALLSHLEIARALERAVRRAGLPYAISQGFSPHMKIAFGSALPVGIGGMRECFDVQLKEYCAPDVALKALQAASVKDLMVLECEYIGAKAPAASVAYPISCYEVEFSKAPSALSVPEVIKVVRKKKERELVVEDFMVEEPVLEGVKLRFALISKPTGSLRADIFLKELLAGCEDVVPLSVTRVKQREV